MTRLTTVLHATSAVVLMGAALAGGGIQTPPAQQAPATAAAAQRAPTLHELKNATYMGVEAAGGAFTLADGRWEGKPYEPGGASRPGVTFVSDFRLTGDLDGDGAEEAVVLLAANAGGTGEMSYLAVVGRPARRMANIATAPIGDRVQVRDARIDSRRIVLDVVQGGERDAACCPGDLVTRNWELHAGGLKEGAPVKTGRLSTETLAGTEWVLRWWGRDDPAPGSPEVTVKFDGPRIAGSAGCNTYVAQLEAGAAPGDLRVGPAGATRKMCPEGQMSVEARFLRQLGGVRRMQFIAGRLALLYSKPDKAFEVMVFDRRPSL